VTSDYWMAEADGALVGIRRTLVNGKTAGVESHRIVADPQGGLIAYSTPARDGSESRIPLKATAGRIEIESVASAPLLRFVYQPNARTPSASTGETGKSHELVMTRTRCPGV
jgi:hypothetical protein